MASPKSSNSDSSGGVSTSNNISDYFVSYTFYHRYGIFTLRSVLFLDFRLGSVQNLRHLIILIVQMCSILYP